MCNYLPQNFHLAQRGGRLRWSWSGQSLQVSGNIVDDVQDAEPAATGKLVMDEPKVREAKSGDQRALARASTRIGARVPMAWRRARRLRTVVGAQHWLTTFARM